MLPLWPRLVLQKCVGHSNLRNGLRPAGRVSYSLPTSGCARRMLLNILQVQNNAMRQPVNLHCLYISHKQSTGNPQQEAGPYQSSPLVQKYHTGSHLGRGKFTQIFLASYEVWTLEKNTVDQ
jgi:hypothetical protein